jgi:hypothetical protein
VLTVIEWLAMQVLLRVICQNHVTVAFIMCSVRVRHTKNTPRALTSQTTMTCKCIVIQVNASITDQVTLQRLQVSILCFASPAPDRSGVSGHRVKYGGLRRYHLGVRNSSCCVLCGLCAGLRMVVVSATVAATAAACCLCCCSSRDHPSGHCWPIFCLIQAPTIMLNYIGWC